VRLIGQEVYVCSPRYARVRVAVTLSGAVSDETRKAVVRALWVYLHPLFGGDDQKGWPVGGAIWPSALLRVVRQAVRPPVVVERVEVCLGDNALDGCERSILGPTELPDLHPTRDITVNAAGTASGRGAP